MNQASNDFGPGARFLFWVAGLDQILIGLAMLIVGPRLGFGPIGPFQSNLLLWGALVIAGGTAVLVAQVVPAERSSAARGCLIFGAATAGVLAFGFISSQGWLSAGTYGLLAAGLLLGALRAGDWLESRRPLDFFTSTVAAGWLVMAVLILIRPWRLAAGAAAPQQLLLGGAGMLVTGALLVAAQLIPRSIARQALPAAAGAIMLVTIYGFGAHAGFTNLTISWGILTLGVVLRPLSPPSWSAWRQRRAAPLLLACVYSLGASLVLIGVVLVVPPSAAREQALLFLALMMLVSAAAAVLLVRELGRPLAELAARAQLVISGGARVQRPPDLDEVGELERAIDQMQQRIAAGRRERELVEAEQAPLRAREQAAKEEVDALLGAAASLGAGVDPETALRTLVERAATLLRADRASYALHRGEQLVIPARWQQGTWTETGHSVRHNGLLWSALVSGQTFVTNALGSEPNANQTIVTQLQLRSQLTAPLIGPSGDRIGVISLNNSRRESGFSARDELLLGAICDTAVTILMRARNEEGLHEAERAAEERKQEVEALLSVADRLSGPAQPDDVLRRILEVAASMLMVRCADIATSEGDHVVRRHTWVEGTWLPGETVLPLDTSLSGWVARRARAVRSSDLTRGHLTYLPEGIGVQPCTALGVPLLGRDGHVLAALCLYDRQDGAPFNDDDERLAEGVAHHAAIALERAKLFEELQAREERLRTQAVTDALTGLPNRSLFIERLEKAVEANRESGSGLAVLFLDLDGFKVVNDSLGHPAGDELLRSVAKRLISQQRRGDLAARFGGDEFVVLLDGIGRGEDAAAVAERISGEMRRFFSIGHRGFFINASVGIAFRGPDSEPCSGEEIIREADIALYRAKAMGKGRVVVYSSDMGSEAKDKLELQTDLQQAVQHGELLLLYQPVIEMATKTIAGVEALIRWQHPKRGLLGPGAFIPMAEETGLIIPVGQWVLEAACKQGALWQRGLSATSQFRVCVNLAARQLEQSDIVQTVATVLRDSGLEPHRLELELTETAIIKQAESTTSTIRELKALGVRLAIDDFGTGYSSLSYLERLAVDTLKIDQSFASVLAPGNSTSAIVQAIVMLAHALKMDVTAEGIETESQLSQLAELGCNFGQGFYFSRPCSAVELNTLLPVPYPASASSAPPMESPIALTEVSGD